MAILAGLLNQADLYDNRVTTIGVERVSRDIDASVAEHNRQLNALMALFATNRTDPQTNYRLAASTRNQPLDENGRARPITFAGSYTVGFPLHFSGNAWGANYVTSVEMTLGEVADIMSTLMDGDSRWMRDHLLAALFYENSTTPWTFTDPQYGALSVYGLANGDTITYQIMNGADSAATDDHVKGAAAVTEAVLQDMHDELVEHPGNGNEIVVFIPTASRATVEALTNFYPISDPNLQSGTAVTQFTGALGIAVPGELIGYCAGCKIVVWAGMPSGYALGVAVGGAPALTLRQKSTPALQGFKKVAERADYPWWEAQYLRIAGFGAWNRVGAIVYKTDNATYAIPTGYTSPMP
jgi:hypothetical protein